MKKLESTFPNMLIVLTLIALVAAAGLASMNNLTKEPIAVSAKKKSDDAIKKVLPKDKVGVIARTEIVEVNDLKINRAYGENGCFIGAAVEGNATGFSGDVLVMVGFDKDGNILEYEVLKQSETPGLGTKMTTWFKPQVADTSLVEKIVGFVVEPAKVNSSILGLNPAKNNLTVSKDGGELDAITASTISSRAFLLAIANAYNAYDEAYKNNLKNSSVEKSIEGQQEETEIVVDEKIVKNKKQVAEKKEIKKTTTKDDLKETKDLELKVVEVDTKTCATPTNNQNNGKEIDINE